MALFTTNTSRQSLIKSAVWSACHQSSYNLHSLQCGEIERSVFDQGGHSEYTNI